MTARGISDAKEKKKGFDELARRLRENLRKRKHQQKARQEQPDNPSMEVPIIYEEKIQP